MITHRQYIKSESPATIGTSQFYSFGRRRSSSSSSSSALTSGTSVEMPMKLEERLNELESNAVRALLSLGEAIVSGSGSPCKAQMPIKKQEETFSCTKPPQQAQTQQPAVSIARSVIVKAEPGPGYYDDLRGRGAQPQPSAPPIPVTQQKSPPLPLPSSVQTPYMREFNSGSISKGLNINSHPQNPPQTISLTPITKSNGHSGPALQYNGPANMATLAPVSIQPVVPVATSSSAPVISTIFYKIPASVATGSGQNGVSVTATPMMSPSFTIIPAANARAVIPLPMVTSNGSSLVKFEPGIVTQNGTPVNWNNIQVLKVPRTSVETTNSGITTFCPLASVTALTSSVGVTNSAQNAPNSETTLLPSPGKGDGKSSATGIGTLDGKSPTKSGRARRRSQSTTKGRSSRVSSGSSELFVTSNVEGLPNIVVDGYEVGREIWAKAFLQNDIIHAAGTLFNALFSSDEIKNCTLNGRNGTRQLCPEKRQAIFKIVAWMRNKCQDPYSFNKSPEDTKILNREEQMMIEKKVFVERRYQTSRKIRDNLSQSSISSPAQPASPPSTQAAAVTSTTCISPSNQSFSAKSNSIPTSSPSHDVPSPNPPSSSCLVAGGPEFRRRDSNGSFSSISTGDGIPKIALIQSSEIIANYFQSADPLPVSSTSSLPGSIINNHHQQDGPPPMKMQKVG